MVTFPFTGISGIPEVSEADLSALHDRTSTPSKVNENTRQAAVKNP
jgi:hypothetical protein